MLGIGRWLPGQLAGFNINPDFLGGLGLRMGLPADQQVNLAQPCLILKLGNSDRDSFS